MLDQTLDLLEGSEQYVLRRLQVANWGTFSGIHDVPIAAKGHLFVGGWKIHDFGCHFGVVDAGPHQL